MNKKTSRILVYVINTVIIILNSLISFLEANTDNVVDVANNYDVPAITRQI